MLRAGSLLRRVQDFMLTSLALDTLVHETDRANRGLRAHSRRLQRSKFGECGITADSVHTHQDTHLASHYKLQSPIDRHPSHQLYTKLHSHRTHPENSTSLHTVGPVTMRVCISRHCERANSVTVSIIPLKSQISTHLMHSYRDRAIRIPTLFLSNATMHFTLR